MPDYRRPPRHLRVPPSEDLTKLPRFLWTDPADFQPEERDEESGDYIDWGVSMVRACDGVSVGIFLGIG